MWQMINPVDKGDCLRKGQEQSPALRSLIMGLGLPKREGAPLSGSHASGVREQRGSGERGERYT